jgi:hypothetical protein
MPCRDWRFRAQPIYALFVGALLLLARPAAAGAPCTGSSAFLPPLQCGAWQDLFDSLLGWQWAHCNSTRNDPCACKQLPSPPSPAPPYVTCDSTGIVTIYSPGKFSPAGKAVGTIPDSIGQLTALDDIVLNWNVWGTIPASFGKLQSLRSFALETPYLGGIIPRDLPFSLLTTCRFGDESLYGSRFACPLPPGAVTSVCAMNASACGFPCSGASVNLPMDQCLAWISFYDEMGGAGWPPRCQSRTDPCSCSFSDSNGGVQCNDANTSITQLLFGVGGGFPSPDVAGTLPASIGAFTDLLSFSVWGDEGDSRIAGSIPASVSAWSRLTLFWPYGNHFTGALPALPYDNFVWNGCQLLAVNSTNRFSCPLPPGITEHCTKYDGSTWTPVTETDCVCTGASANLAVDQCLAWIEFYDSTGGSGWKVCSGMRTDPCACMGVAGNWPVCSMNGSVVYQM